MSVQKCPLPLSGAFLYEEDIPHECRECLRLTLDSDPGSDLNPLIGVGWEHDSTANFSSTNDCDHEMYYWQTGVSRESDAVRHVEQMANCDVCDNFVIRAILTQCKNE